VVEGVLHVGLEVDCVLPDEGRKNGGGVDGVGEVGTELRMGFDESIDLDMLVGRDTEDTDD
jgi:hypothetical protein